MLERLNKKQVLRQTGHPRTKILPKNTNENIVFMIRRAIGKEA